MHKRAILTAVLCLTACEKPDPPEVLAAKAEFAILRDPDSAIFKLPPMINEITPTGGAYCGLINARNGYGGMSGFEPFAAYIKETENGTVAVLNEPIAVDGNHTEATYRFCEIHGYTEDLLESGEEWRPPSPDRN